MSKKIQKMDNNTFNELLEAGEIGLILLDGGESLTKEQLAKVKAKAQEQSEEKLQKQKHAQATQPGYIQSQIIPALTKVLKGAGKAMAGNQQEQKQQVEQQDTKQEMDQEFQNPEQKPTVSEKTKDTIKGFKRKTNKLAAGLGSKIKKLSTKLFGGKTPSAEPVEEEKKTPAEHLGSIYELMVQIEEDRRLELEEKKDNKESEESEDERRHKEIIKALSIKRKPGKPKKTKKKRSKKIKDTAKPAEPPKPSATQTVSTAGQTARQAVATAAKVTAGVGLAGAAGAIAARESGGNYDITYGDRADKKTGKIVNSANQTTPEKFLGKKLTDFTLEEVKAFQDKKNAEVPGTGAVGAYQFMPTTLFGQTVNGKHRPGLVEQLKLPMNTKFTKEVQDQLFELLHASDVNTLKKMGVPITPGYEYMAHYIGAGGAKLVYEESKKSSDKTVAQTLTDAGKKVGHNPELHKIKAKDFEKVLQDRLSSTGLIPHSSDLSPPPVTSNNTGDKVNKKSTDNKDVRRELEKQKQTQQTTVNVTNVTSTNNTTEENKPVDDRPAPFRK